jgi:broad specificity phosphatase PhoE
MPVLIARHAERVDYAVRSAEGRNWQATAERPWDTPITDAGILQANALGMAIGRHCLALGLPPVTRVYCSPLLRCAQTAAAACDILGPELRVCVEPALRETAGEDWFRSWAVEGADGTWGGPEGCRAGVQPTSLRPEAKIPSDGAAHDWLCADTAVLRERLSTAEAGTDGRPGLMVSAAARLVEEYVPYSFSEPMGAHCWGAFESEEMQVARLGRWFDHIATLYPEETILLVSHGGPSASLFRHSQRDRPVPAAGWKTCKYCGLYALRSIPPQEQAEGGVGGGQCRWEALLEAEDSHLAEVPQAGQSSGSSAAEQAAAEVVSAITSTK